MTQQPSWEEDIRKRFDRLSTSLSDDMRLAIADWWILQLQAREEYLQKRIEKFIEENPKDLDYQAACFDILSLINQKSL